MTLSANRLILALKRNRATCAVKAIFPFGRARYQHLRQMCCQMGVSASRPTGSRLLKALGEKSSSSRFDVWPVGTLIAVFKPGPKGMQLDCAVSYPMIASDGCTFSIWVRKEYDSFVKCPLQSAAIISSGQVMRLSHSSGRILRMA